MTPAKKAAKKLSKKVSAKTVSKTATGAAAQREKAAKAKAKVKATAKSTATLLKAGLIDHEMMTDDHRKRVAKLKPEEVKALVTAKKKLGFTGKLHGAGADFF